MSKAKHISIGALGAIGAILLAVIPPVLVIGDYRGKVDSNCEITKKLDVEVSETTTKVAAVEANISAIKESLGDVKNLIKETEDRTSTLLGILHEEIKGLRTERNRDEN